jgi:hypothetical protein
MFRKWHAFLVSHGDEALYVTAGTAPQHGAVLRRPRRPTNSPAKLDWGPVDSHHPGSLPAYHHRLFRLASEPRRPLNVEVPERVLSTIKSLSAENVPYRVHFS